MAAFGAQLADIQNRIDTLFPGLNNKAEITNENTVEVSNKFYPALSGVTFDLYAEKGSNEFCIKSGR